MNNVYSIKGSTFEIVASGSPNRNRLKNDLIWELNSFLATKYDLYSFIVKRHVQTTDVCDYSLICGKLIAEFTCLDKCFFSQVISLSESEFDYYRHILDPKKKTDNDVFRESLLLENTDLEYIAVSNLRDRLLTEEQFKSKTLFHQWIVSVSSVYVSLFSAKEMTIKINEKTLVEPIKKIIKKYCVRRV